MTNVPANVDYTIRGDLRFEFSSEYNLHSEKAAQLRCFGNVEYRGQLLKNLPLLTLDIRGWGVEWTVRDSFPDYLPYMKPVKAFREYLEVQMRKALRQLPEGKRDSAFSPLWMGINSYISNLNTFKEARSLANQIRSSIEARIKRAETSHRHDYSQEQAAHDLLQILELLQEEPVTGLAFFVGEPLAE